MSALVQDAIAAIAAGRPDQARALLTQLGPVGASDPLALQVWSIVLGDGEQGEAQAVLERAVRIAPGDSQAQFNLAVRLQAHEIERAMAHYAHALALAPDHLGALNNLSDLYRRRGRADEAWTLMERFRAGGGDTAGLEIRLAKIALDTHRWDEAERWFKAAAAQAPGSASVAFEHSMLTLAREDFERGWAQYEARIANTGLPALGAFPHPQRFWDGIGRAGSKVLIHREQGLGDAVMFATALDGIVDQGVETHVTVPPPLTRLFTYSFPKLKVWSTHLSVGADVHPPQTYTQLMGPIDAQAPMCSLGFLRMRSGPPAPRAYIRAPKEEVECWRTWLDALVPKGGGLRVGLAFMAQKPAHHPEALSNGLKKSIPAHALEPLADVEGVSWVALHDRGSAAAVADIPRLKIADPSSWITDMADTAALIANLDVVVSVDTGVAHLAGAMGKPVLLLLRRNADWRWGIERTDSYWYPNVRTFRQTREGEWSDAVAAAAKALGSR